jgi:hypothetical protein
MQSDLSPRAGKGDPNSGMHRFNSKLSCFNTGMHGCRLVRRQACRWTAEPARFMLFRFNDDALNSMGAAGKRKPRS